MEEERGYLLRLRVIYGILCTVLACFVAVLYQAQIVDGQAYYEQSTSRIPTTEIVEASRGILTDRNGKVLVSNREIYTITFDSSLLKEQDDQNAAILRLVELCERYDIKWDDNLPVSRYAPFTWTTAGEGSSVSNQRTRLQRYLSNRGWSDSVLTAEKPYPAWADTLKGAELRETYGNTFSAQAMMELLCEEFEVSEEYSAAEARKIVGVRYELALRKLYDTTAYIFAKDVPTELLSEISDGRYVGVKIGTESVRQYETEYAAHVLGRIAPIDNWDEYENTLKAQGYRLDDLIGEFGAEKAFESYLRGTDGKRIVTTNEEGKVTGEIYSVEPEPGATVALTLDIDFQEQVEKILAARIEEMTAEDGLDTRGGAVAVVEVGTGDALALASYPTYDLSTYQQNFSETAANPAKPFTNRVTQGAYAPGSTFKPLTAVAALESGIITVKDKINTTGLYTYYAPSYTPKCWIYPGRHGLINVSQAITDSCNYFFYDVGRRMGISKLVEYAAAFGLGQSTGIEIGDRAGVMDGPDYRSQEGILFVGGDTLQISIGQGQSLFTPLQLANYIATLVGGGERYDVHLLKNVRSYKDNTLLEVYDEGPVNTVEMSENTVDAVKKGMGDLVTSGSVSRYFQDCVVSAGAKTGSAQVGTTVANGVFVAFAPFENPEIAVAVVIEKGGSGSALASTAVGIINAYFSGSETGGIPVEGDLIP